MVEDEGVFTMPYSATVTYLRAFDQEWPELVCAESPRDYPGMGLAVPRADTQDF
jgi:hypothetical protein